MQRSLARQTTCGEVAQLLIEAAHAKAAGMEKAVMITATDDASARKPLRWMNPLRQGGANVRVFSSRRQCPKMSKQFGTC